MLPPTCIIMPLNACIIVFRVFAAKLVLLTLTRVDLTLYQSGTLTVQALDSRVAMIVTSIWSPSVFSGNVSVSSLYLSLSLSLSLSLISCLSHQFYTNTLTYTHTYTGIPLFLVKTSWCFVRLLIKTAFLTAPIWEPPVPRYLFRSMYTASSS